MIVPTPKMLRTLLRYEPATGLLYWRKRTADLFNDGEYSAVRKCRSWNARHSGKEALTAVNSAGYRRGRIFGRDYLAHRVIFAMQTNAWPIDQIDHIDGDTCHNRMENLRDVTRSENNRNAARRADNSTGAVGVGWHKQTQKWVAYIRAVGVQKHLGYFADKDDAIAARAAAEIKYNYSPNHGRMST